MAVAVALPVALLLAAAVLDLTRNMMAQGKLEQVMLNVADSVELSDLPPANSFTEIIAADPSATPRPNSQNELSRRYTEAAGKYCRAAEAIFAKEFQGLLSTALSEQNHAFQFAIVHIPQQAGSATILGSSDLATGAICSSLDRVNALKADSLNMDAAELAELLNSRLQQAGMKSIGVLGHVDAGSNSALKDLKANLDTYWIIGVGYARQGNVLLGMFFPKAGVVGQKMWIAYPLQAGIES